MQIVGKEISEFQGKYYLTQRLDRLDKLAKQYLEINFSELIKHFY